MARGLVFFLYDNSGPVAEITTTPAPRPKSEVSKSKPMTALAPRSKALDRTLSIASTLAFSSSVVNAVTSPPTIDWSPAMNFPKRPLVHGVRPVTTPRIFVILYPATVGVVVKMNPFSKSQHLLFNNLLNIKYLKLCYCGITVTQL